MPTPLTAAHRTWRLRVFVATWFSYVGFYFCRKHWNSAKAAIETQNGWDIATTAGNIGAAYLVAYAIGQYMASHMGSRIGPRLNLLTGMAVSIAVTAGMALSSSPWMFGAFMFVLGIAQATGWSGNVGTMANWFHKHERGKVMGWWSTNFTVGSIATGFVFAFILGDLKPADQPWQRCFWLGAAFLVAVWIQFWFLQRDRPEDVGLAGIDDPATEVDESKQTDLPKGFTREQWKNIMLVGGFYFCAKLIRYAIWSWAAYFLQTKFGKSGSDANLYATAFEVCGVPGIILTGWISDRYFQSKRAGISLIMTLGMCVATLALIVWGQSDATVFTILLGVVGFFLFGPDSLLSGAGAMDVGNRRVALRATAIIACFGAVGPVVQEVIIPRVSKPEILPALRDAIAHVHHVQQTDLTLVFGLLFASAALSAMFCAALVIRNRRGGKGI